MKKIRIISLLLIFLLTVPVSAGDAAYCFRNADLGQDLEGICIQKLPREGALMLGSRALRPGDVLTIQQLQAVSFHSVSGGPGELSYLPISREGVLETASFLIPGRKNLAPVAEDFILETYRDLPNSGLFRAYDPEQKEVTITLVQQPRKGTVEIGLDGKFTYTPKKKKVGTDCFTYEARDPEGNVSREATITVTILKPSEGPKYQDTAGTDCSFSAEWMKNTGIFTAENVGDACCFLPEKSVSRGEFLTMLLKTLGIGPEMQVEVSQEQIPIWLRPYAAAALRWGLTEGLPRDMDWEKQISGAEAAVMIQNALDLPVPVFSEEENIPAWAASSLAALRHQGILLEAEEMLTRGKTAGLLYRVHICRTSR